MSAGPGWEVRMNRARGLCLVLIGLVVAAACSSSTGRSDEWRTYMHDYDLIYNAALAAMYEMNLKIISESYESGVILGETFSDASGAVINMDVTVSRYLDSAQLRVKAIPTGGHANNPVAIEDADELELRYLGQVDNEIGRLRLLRAPVKMGPR